MTPPICSAYSSSSVSIIQQDSPIVLLPGDIFTHNISKYLHAKDILSYQSTCKHLYTGSQNDKVWERRLPLNFPRIDKKFSNYRSAYKLIYSNFTQGVETSFNEDQVTLAVFGSTLTSGSYDKTIKVWDLHSKECIATLQGHEDEVSSLAVSGSTLVSGSYDEKIKVWDLNSKECTATLRGHGSIVSSVAVLENRLFSGSWDGTIRIWDLNSKECISTLCLHKDMPYGIPLAVLDSTLFSSVCTEMTIQVWDLNSKECIAILQGHENRIRSLAVLDNTLISGSSDKTIKIWDLNSKACIATLKGHELGIYSLALLDNTLISGSYDKTIKVWDLNSKECIATLQGHGHHVTSLAVLGNTLISGSIDKTIKIWDLNSKKCIASQAGENEIRSLAISEGKLILSYGKRIKVCDFTDDFPLRKTPWT
jgi:WD40 repeat protein